MYVSIYRKRYILRLILTLILMGLAGITLNKNIELSNYSYYIALFILMISAMYVIYIILHIINAKKDISQDMLISDGIYARFQQYRDEQNMFISRLSEKYGNVDVKIPILHKKIKLDNELINIDIAAESFYVFLSSELIYYKERTVAFNQIIDCVCTDKTTIISNQTGTATSTTSTDTFSAVGRSLVGGALAGEVGAIIGGATAEKDTNTKFESKIVSKTIHDYTIQIHIADIFNPFICGRTKKRRIRNIICIL
jgi:hypothetical protein